MLGEKSVLFAAVVHKEWLQTRIKFTKILNLYPWYAVCNV
jgi:hypothetical protein